MGEHTFGREAEFLLGPIGKKQAECLRLYAGFFLVQTDVILRDIVNVEYAGEHPRYRSAQNILEELALSGLTTRPVNYKFNDTSTERADILKQAKPLQAAWAKIVPPPVEERLFHAALNLVGVHKAIWGTATSEKNPKQLLDKASTRYMSEVLRAK